MDSSKKESLGKRRKRRTQSQRANVVFPVGRIGRLIRAKRYSPYCSKEAPVFVASVMSYLCAEVLEIAGHVAVRSSFHRITPRCIELGVRNDPDLARFFQNQTFRAAGTAPLGSGKMML